MRVRNLDRGEVVAVIGGVVLVVSLFLVWYSTGNKFGHIGNLKGDLTAWQALTVLRYLLLIGAIAPIILAYIILREHALSWPRGELTAVIAIYVIGLVLVRGLLIKPGEPAGEISLAYGWFVALLGGILILVGALIRTGENEKARKPPGMP